MKKFVNLTMIGLLGFATIGALPLKVQADTVIQAPQTSVNDYLLGLKYDPTAILAQNGQKLSNVPTTQQMLQNGQFTVVRHEKKSLMNNSADIAVVDANANNVYAGEILKADQSLVNNTPTQISLKQAPLTLSVDLPGITNGDSHLTVQNPSASQVRDGVNTLLARWNDKYAQNYQNIPAKIEYSESMAYSLDQLKTKFGASFAKLQVPLNIDFDAIHSGQKQVQIINFRQIYYTVGIDAPTQPSGFFDKSVTPQQLAQSGIDSKTPPVYVSNVSYGRSMYIKLETDSKSTKVKEAFNAALKGVDVKNNTEYEDILKNTSFTAVILGGDAGQATKVISGKIEDLKNIIQAGANYNKLNPGVPIAYKTNFVKDNAPATISSASDYVETTSTTYNSSNLILDHTGGYVAKFFIDWDEVSYDKNGREILTHKEWQGNGQKFTAPWNQEIQIPANARNLHIVAQECTGLAWDWWRTIYDQTNVALAGKRTISIWGTTLVPKVSDEVMTDNQ